uniref:Elongation of very long chain fatty acids protein n=1 Tax=Myxobolus squamalis TaxID=59785 RepID=A0A6B2G5A6_MYXSQ
MVWFHYLYFLSKIAEFTDTIVFVLRKKFNQVSVFHVYHHLSIFLLMWYYFKVIPGSLAMPLATLNCIVHVFMYSYYLLSGLGPSVQKFLWWKRYITQMQLVQLALIVSELSYMLISGTYFPKNMIIVLICYILTLIGFFLHFYLNAYKSHSKTE